MGVSVGVLVGVAVGVGDANGERNHSFDYKKENRLKVVLVVQTGAFTRSDAVKTMKQDIEVYLLPHLPKLFFEVF